MIDHAEDTRPWYQTLSRYQWLVLIVAWMGWVFDIADTALFNLAKGPMMRDILGEAAYGPNGIGPRIEGNIQTLFLIGWSIGGLVFGILADRWGRTKTLTLTILLYCAFTALTALCRSVEQVMIVRFLTGVGIGGEWAAGAALIAEVLPNRTRAAAAAFLQTAAAVGPILASLAAAALSEQSWRWLFLIGVLPAFMVVIIRFKVREPERWQQAQQKGEAKTNELKRMFGHPTWRRHAIVATMFGIAGIAGAGTIAFWLPNLVDRVSVGMAPGEIQDRKALALIIGHAGTFLGVIFFPWLCERIGRRTAFGLFFLLSPLSLLLLWWASKDFNTLCSVAPITSFITIGLSAGFALYLPELFPTRIRGTGLGFAYNTGRIFSAPFPLITGWIITQQGGNVGIGVAFAGLVYLIGLAAVPFAPETRGKALPEEDPAPLQLHVAPDA
jgi:MFS family permease